MGFYIYIFGPSALGFIIGGILAIDHRTKSNRHYQSIKLELADLMRGREDQLPGLENEIVEIFERHKYQLVERSDEELVFKHPPLFEPSAASIAFWTLITFGGVLAALLAIHFVGHTDERVSMRLIPDSSY